MSVRRAVPLLALAITLLALGVPLAFGSAAARLGAAFALVAIVAGMVAVVQSQRVEHADDPVQPSTAALISESMLGTGLICVGLAIYLVAMLLNGVAPGSGPREESGWAGPTLAAVALVGAAVLLAGGVLSVRRREGIERQQLVEATSIAFFVTMLGALGYATFEAFADAPTISMWNIWGLGGLTWAVSTVALQRRAR